MSSVIGILWNFKVVRDQNSEIFIAEFKTITQIWNKEN